MNYLNTKNMEPKEVKQILQKYFEGTSTEQEEQLLTDYFNSQTIAPEFRKYQQYFVGLHELSVEGRDEVFEEEIMDYILEKEYHEKTRYRWLWQTVSGVAAALLIALLAVNLYTGRAEWEDTYSDPDQAYAEALSALHYVAGYYQKGMEGLEPMKSINKASKPLNKSLNTLDKGFQEIQEMEGINKKLKKQEQ
jgi:hypothetical protein